MRTQRLPPYRQLLLAYGAGWSKHGGYTLGLRLTIDVLSAQDLNLFGVRNPFWTTSYGLPSTSTQSTVAVTPFHIHVTVPARADPRQG